MEIFKDKHFILVQKDTKFPKLTSQVHPLVQCYVDRLMKVASNFDLKQLIIFGSSISYSFMFYLSDVDIAYEFNTPISEEVYSNFANSVRNIFKGQYSVDLIDVTTTDSFLLQDIQEGVHLIG